MGQSKFRHMGVALAATLAVAGLGYPAAARAEAASQGSPVTLEVEGAVEFWRNLSGGLDVGGATIGQAQVGIGFDGDAVGWNGFSAYAMAFKTSSQSLSGKRTGDIMTASNLEAPGIERLMEAWVSQSFGQEDAPGWVALTGGILDLNRTFNSTEPAGLFLNDSHGTQSDLSHSGLTGPSVYPITALGAQVDWRPSERLVLHAGAFAAPDPGRVNNFADVELSERNGAILIAQADYDLTDAVQASLGVWRYTAKQESVTDPSRRREPRPGVYAAVQGPTPLPGAPTGWVRGGFADHRVQVISGYLGGGLVWEGLIPGRDADAFGLAVAHAFIGGPARRTFDLPDAETSLEATYAIRLGPHVELQPDVQYIINPAGAPGLKNATLIGFRVVARAAVGGRRE